MGILRDVAIIGGLIGATILFRERIGQAFAETGEVLGSGIGGAFESFLSSLTGGPPTVRDPTQAPFTIDPTAAGALTPEQVAGATAIRQTETGVFVDSQQVATIIPQPSLIDTIGGFLGGLIPSIPTAEAVEAPPIQGPIAPLPVERPLTLAEIAPSIMEPVPTPTVISQLPDSQVFVGAGPSFIGGVVRENPIDTLSEVLAAFPQLTASQAADFLSEFSGILPSQVGLIDPDIRNITANIEGVNIPVPTIGISDLRQQEIAAAKISCSLFGLNCELAGMG